ncbi:MAG TPA: hypothetical protein ENH82_05800, partial [bacterium]|nr:hypothetical protein [bacterium]
MIRISDEDKLILEMCKKERDISLISSLIKKENFDWHDFFENISRHSIAPFILDRLLKYAFPESHKEILSVRAKEEILKIMARRRIYQNELKHIQLILQKSGIQSILMKGLAIDFAQSRTIGDMDLLVREEKLITAINRLREIGYKYVGNILNHNLKSREKNNIKLQMSWNNQFQLYNRKNNVLLELHTNLFERRRVYSVNLDTLLDNVDVFWKEKQKDENLNCYVLSYEHSLLLMCLHNALKRSPANETFILKNIVDISSLIQHGIIWDRFMNTSTTLNIAPLIYFSLLLTNKLLDTKIPKYVFNSLKNNCTRSQLFLTNVHFKSLKSPGVSSMFYSKLYRVLCPFIFGNSWKERIKWIFLFPIIFPPRWKMATYYNVKRNSPFIYFTYLINP